MKLKVVTAYNLDKEVDRVRDAGFEVTRVAGPANTEDLVIEKMRGFDAIAAFAEPYPAKVLEGLKDDLKILVRHGIGYDKVDIERATQLGICVCNTPGTMSTGVAEETVAMMLECTRGFYRAHIAMQHGKWDRGNGPTNQMEGSTVGLIGFGNIGQRVAQYLKGFQCRILAYDIYYNEDKLQELGVEKATLDEIAAQSDFVSVHVPALPETRQIVNEAFLAAMKPSAFLINTSRGDTVDEKALISALQNHIIAGAALDVFEVEPTPVDNPLRYMDNCFVNPHRATYTYGCIRAGFDGIVKCLKEYEAGEIPQFCLNPEYVKYKK